MRRESCWISTRVRSAVALVLASMSAASWSQGQSRGSASSSIREASVDVTFPAPFTRVASVRELSDERVIVVDAQERSVLVVGPRTARARLIGRQGDGPGEYRNPILARPLGGDSTLVVDGSNRKWYLLERDEFVPLSEAYRDVNLRAQADAQGVSRNGVVLQVRPLGVVRRIPSVPGSPPELADSIAFVLVKPYGGPDTIARGKSTFLGVTSKDARFNGAFTRYAVILNPLQTNDQAILFADGTVAVAYSKPYRVDWRSPAGRWTRGTPVAGADVPLTDVVRRRIAENYLRDDSGAPVFSPSDFPPWPHYVPAFAQRALYPGADGRLYVVRVSLDESPLVDVFDRSGLRTETVRLPANSRFLGSGARGLYVVIKNADDEEILRRLR